MKIALPVVAVVLGVAATGVAGRAQTESHSLNPYVISDPMITNRENQMAGEDWALVKSSHFKILAETADRETVEKVVRLENRLEQFYRALETSGVKIHTEWLPLPIVLFEKRRDLDLYKPAGTAENVSEYALNGPHAHFLAATLAVATNRRRQPPVVGAPAGAKAWEIPADMQHQMTVNPGDTPNQYIIYNPANDDSKPYHRQPLAMEVTEITNREKPLQELIAHLYFSAAEPPVPAWVEAGLAAVYATSQPADGTHNDIGLVPRHNPQMLQEAAKRMAESNGQPLSQEAEAWLFIHYLMFDTGNGGSARLVQYLQLLNSPQARDAFPAAFGDSLTDAERKAGESLNKIPPDGYRINVPEEEGAAPIEVSQAPKEDIESALGSLFVLSRPKTH